MRYVYVFIAAAAIISAVLFTSMGGLFSGNTVREAQHNTTSKMAQLASGQPFIGNSTAKVTVIDFSDPQCPSCREFHDYNYPILKKEFIDTGKVKFVTFNVILPQDPASVPSFMAASCARRQLNDSGFFKTEDIIYEREHSLGSGIVYYDNLKIKGWIKEGIDNLNYSEWQSCFDSNETKQVIEQNSVLAGENGVHSLPTVFINDIPIVGNQPYSVYENQIKAALKQ